MSPAPIAAIVGPTASGKTDLALAVADRLPVEILVADSRQVYRGMDVGTAKPDAAARRAVPHHLLDLVEPNQPFTVADWVAHARRLVPEIQARGRLPLVVGGTGLYISALIDGFDLASQPWSPAIHDQLAAELVAGGLDVMAARLQALDPSAAARIDRHNPRRVLRALERAVAAGAAPGPPRAQPWDGPLAQLGIARPRAVLADRIAARAARMFANGLLGEVERLRAAGYGPELGPMSGHGYREAFRVLDGEWSVEQAVEVTARHTRQYAKRQLTWFRRDPRITWLDAEDRPAEELAESGVRLLRSILTIS